MQVHAAILIGLAIYATLMLCVSVFWMMRVKESTDYLLAGRGLPWWILTGTITATGIGTGVVIGASGVAYQHGWAGCAYPIGLGFGTVVTGLLFSKMRRFQFMTLSEEVASYYDANRVVVEISNISLFISQLCWLTVQIIGGAAVLSVVTGLAPWICILGAGVITAMISIPGGLKTVAYTDTLQAIILLSGLGCLTYMALDASGGIAGLRESVPAAYSSFLGVESFGGWKIASLILVLSLSVVADPGRRLSMFSAKTEAGARWSMVLGGSIVMVFSVVVGIVGMYAYTLNPNLPDPDQTVPWLVINVLPTWLAAFVVVSIASATFSSASTNAIAAGTFFVRHIYPLFTGRYSSRPLTVTRWALVASFVIATSTALVAGTIVKFVLGFLPLTMSGIGVIVLLGVFWRRATWQGALAALITTPLVTLIFRIFDNPAEYLTAGSLLHTLAEFCWNQPAIPATFAGFAAHIIVTLLTPPPTRTFEEVAATLAEAREQTLHTGEGGPALNPALMAGSPFDSPKQTHGSDDRLE